MYTIQSYRQRKVDACLCVYSRGTFRMRFWNHKWCYSLILFRMADCGEFRVMWRNGTLIILTTLSAIICYRIADMTNIFIKKTHFFFICAWCNNLPSAIKCYVKCVNDWKWSQKPYTSSHNSEKTEKHLLSAGI